MTKTIRIKTMSAEETLALGQKLGEVIRLPLVIALRGDLGSGKTVLVKGIAAGLGVPPEPPVTSPTFTLVNEYAGRLKLFHVDLYRLSGAADAGDIGLDDILSGAGAVAIEWAEHLEDEECFAPDIIIDIRIAGENERILTLFFHGPETANLVEEMQYFSPRQ